MAAAPAPSPAARALRTAGLVVGLVALGLQFALTIPASMEAGRSLAGSIVFYFSFFTILTNIGVVLTYLADLSGRPRFLASGPGRAGVAVAITVVMIVYAILLAPIWQPEGLSLLCDVLLHYAAPMIFIAWWLVVRDGSARFRHIPIWLIYPLAYLVVTIARGYLAGEVPYPFLDVAGVGWGGAIRSTIGIAVLFLVLGAVVVRLDRRLPLPAIAQRRP